MLSVSMPMLLLVALVSVVVSVVSADCPVPDPDAVHPVNCSFSPDDECFQQYTRRNEHGLSWEVAGRTLFSDPVPGGHKQVLVEGEIGNFYLYMRGTSDHRILGDWLDLISPLTLIHSGCLTFVLHNSVPLANNFKVYLRSREEWGADNTEIFQDTGFAGDVSWTQHFVSLDEHWGPYQLVFSAKYSGNKDEIIALDEVTYSNQSCSLRNSVNYATGDCDFEEPLYECDYHDVDRDVDATDAFRWSPVSAEMLPYRRISYRSASPKTSTLPKLRRKGKVLALVNDKNEDYVRRNRKFNISSPKLNIGDEGCLSLNYFSGNPEKFYNGQAALSVSAAYENGTEGVLYEFPATLTPLTEDWLEAWIPLPTGQYSLKFTGNIADGVYNDHEYDLMAIDDVEIYHKPCQHVQCGKIICDDDREEDPCQMVCIGRGRKHHVCRCYPDDPPCEDPPRDTVPGNDLRRSWS